MFETSTIWKLKSLNFSFGLVFIKKNMLPHQKLIYPCPFCDKETLEVLWWPSHKTAKRSRSAASGSKTTWRRVPEGLVLLSEKCSNCGATAKEIERKWAGKD